MEIWLINTEVFEIFKYRKYNNRYWDKAKLHLQKAKNVNLILKILNRGYKFLIFGDNKASHSVKMKISFNLKQ